MVFTLMVRYIVEHFLFLIGYMGSIGGAFPKPLSAKEEEMYFKLYKEGDEDAKNVLIERNLRLVVHVAKKYATQWSDSDDLISIGAIGLMKAVSTYDYEKGHRFATYAAKCVQNAMVTSRKQMQLKVCFAMLRKNAILNRKLKSQYIPYPLIYRIIMTFMIQLNIIELRKDIQSKGLAIWLMCQEIQ